MSTFQPLTLQKSLEAEGTLILGALVAKQLQARGVCAFFVNKEGTIELAHPIELALDYLPEEQALRILFERHKYTDSQLIAYLKGREARLPLGGEGGTHATHL